MKANITKFDPLVYILEIHFLVCRCNFNMSVLLNCLVQFVE
jgi:hypothetical protein